MYKHKIILEERWEESIELEDDEIIEWLDEAKDVINNDKLLPEQKLQKLIYIFS